jgi:thiol-disulfide isomerase/thioredoxin
MKRTILLIALATGMMTNIQAQTSTLSGTLRGVPEGSRIVISQIVKDRLQPVDTLRLDKKGEFKAKLTHKEPAYYVLQTTERNGGMCHILLEPKDKVKLDIVYFVDRHAFSIQSCKGSRNVELYRQFNDLLLAAITPEQQAQLPDRASRLLANNSKLLMSAFLVTFFDNNFDNYVSLYAKIRNDLITDYPDDPFVKHIDKRLQGVVFPGMEAPEIAMNDPEGNERRLSSLRGNIVLIDFWASWCGPCRRENPNVVKLYEKYHDQGFEIYSVSLDKTRDAWIRAINDDKLIWPNHVSDLNGWTSSGGKTYGISSVPSTVLVDRYGKVVARNLRGAELEQKLQQLLEEQEWVAPEEQPEVQDE